MGNSSKKRSAAAKPDFKRVKAKVGKRAPKKANCTDTSFQSASLNVRKQTVDHKNDDTNNNSTTIDSLSTLISRRGNSIQDLTSKMQHPAALVRISAVKGLKDIVLQSTNTNSSNSNDPLVLSHLHVLVTTTAKCCVDQEDEVRTIGLSVLEAIIKHLGDTGPGRTKQQRQKRAETLLQPFGRLLLAFLSSALNSLDRSIRRDGATATQLLCSTVPRLVTPFWVDLVPCFVRLLSERLASVSTASIVSNDATSNKKQPREGSTSRSILVLLKSLLSLVRTSGDTKQLDVDVDNQYSFLALPPDLRVTSSGGGGSRNALVFVKMPMNRGGCHYGGDGDIVSFHKQTDLYAALRKWKGQKQPTNTNNIINNDKRSSLLPLACGSGSSQEEPSLLLSLSTAVDLLERLRDILLETTQAANWVNSECMCLPSRDVDSFLLVTKVLFEIFDRKLIAHMDDGGDTPVAARTRNSSTTNSSSTPSSLATSFRKVSIQIVNSLMEALPLRVEDTLSSPYHTSMAVNSQLCLAVLSIVTECGGITNSIGGVTVPPLEQKRCMKAVIGYVQSSLQDISSARGQTSAVGLEEQKEEDAKKEEVEDPGLYSHPILRVFAKIVSSKEGRELLSQQQERQSSSHHLVISLVQEFCTTFFGASHGCPDGGWARSASGRQVARLAHVVFLPYNYDIWSVAKGIGPIAFDVVQRLVQYLIVWEGDFLYDSFAALSLIHKVVRRLDTNTISGADEDHSKRKSELLEYLRSTLVSLLEFRICTASGQSNNSTSSCTEKSIIFEQYTEQLQRIVISTLVLLGLSCSSSSASSSSTAATSLSTICSRSRLLVNGSVPGHMATFITESVHSMRKTMPMQVYLAFVVDATGVMQVKEAASFGTSNSSKNEYENDQISSLARRVLDFDSSTKTASRHLVECGSAGKVLPMLHPFLLSCLRKDFAKTPYCDLLQMRTAIAILSTVLLFSNVIEDEDKSSSSSTMLSVMPIEFKDQIVHAAGLFVRHVFRLCGRTEEQSPLPDLMLRPLVALLSMEPDLFSALFQNTVALVVANQEEGFNRADVLEAMLLLVRMMVNHDNRASAGSALVDHADNLLMEAQKIAACLGEDSNSTEQTLAGRILTELEVAQTRWLNRNSSPMIA